VCYHDQSNLFLAIQLDEQLAKPTGGSVVQRAGGLIGEQKPGRIDEGADDRNSLAFAARKLTWTMPETLAQTDAFQEAFGPRRGAGPQFSIIGGQSRHEDILDHAALREQIVGLEHEPDLTVPQGGQWHRAEARKVPAGEQYLTTGRLVKRADNLKKGALAGTRRPHNGQRLTHADLHRDVVQDR